MKRSTFTIALALLSGICFSQESGKRVGISTTTPEATLQEALKSIPIVKHS